MRYENPLPAEDVNYTKEHPLKEFAQLVIGIAVVILFVTVALNYTAGYLARLLPFEYEQKMVGEFAMLDNGDSPIKDELQALADKLAKSLDLPAEIEIHVHYDQADTINAFATLGGHLTFYQGLLDELESEQELAAVMAHEIAHIKHRHPIVALGKGVTLASLAGFIGGVSGSGAGQWLIGSSANLSLLQFSREQELQADSTAAAALFTHYGHIGGAKELFKKFSKIESESFDTALGAELFRSHPYSNERWLALEELAKLNAWPTSGALRKRDYSTPQGLDDAEQ